MEGRGDLIVTGSRLPDSERGPHDTCSGSFK